MAFKTKRRSNFIKSDILQARFELEKWNISDTANVSFVMETVDKLGRTEELRFHARGHRLYWAGSAFYGGPIIKYDYPENMIIETYFSADNEIANDFLTSEVPFRTIYYLNEKNEIERFEEKYKIDFEWNKESLEKTIEHLEFYKQFESEKSDLNKVFGYNYAFAKLNEIDPKMK